MVEELGKAATAGIEERSEEGRRLDGDGWKEDERAAGVGMAERVELQLALASIVPATNNILATEFFGVITRETKEANCSRVMALQRLPQHYRSAGDDRGDDFWRSRCYRPKEYAPDTAPQ